MNETESRAIAYSDSSTQTIPSIDTYASSETEQRHELTQYLSEGGARDAFELHGKWLLGITALDDHMNYAQGTFVPNIPEAVRTFNRTRVMRAGIAGPLAMVANVLLAEELRWEVLDSNQLYNPDVRPGIRAHIGVDEATLESDWPAWLVRNIDTTTSLPDLAYEKATDFMVYGGLGREMHLAAIALSEQNRSTAIVRRELGERGLTDDRINDIFLERGVQDGMTTILDEAERLAEYPVPARILQPRGKQWRQYHPEVFLQRRVRNWTTRPRRSQYAGQ